MKKILVIVFILSALAFTVSCAEEKCTEHLFSDWNVKTAPTCIDTGLDTRECEKCGFFEERTVDIVDHSFDEWYVDDVLPGIFIGHERRDCKFCDLYETKFEEVKTKLGVVYLTRTENTLESQGMNSRQGGCYNGSNYYQAFIAEDESSSFIAKNNIKTGEVIFSEPRAMGHANDMTYIPELNQVLVCDSETKVFFYDADTLEFIKECELSKNIGAISYNAHNDTYTGYGNSKDKTIYILDENFNFIGQFPMKETMKTAQGICSDDTYVYSLYTPFVDGRHECHIIIHDYNGNYIATLNLSLSNGYEAENLSIIDGQFYIAVCTPNPFVTLNSVVPYPS